MVQFWKTQFACTVFVVATIMTLESVELVRCDRYYGRHLSTLQLREKPRSTRGFKGAALSTARGFGKRDSVSMDSLPELEPYEQLYSPRDRAILTSILTHLLQNDRESVRTLVTKYLDSNRGSEGTQSDTFRRTDDGFSENANNDVD